MTRIIITLLLSLLTLLSCSTKKQVKTEKIGATISVTVPRISSNKGNVLFSLFDSKENFDNKLPFQSLSISASKEPSTIKFINVPKGNYAIIAFHDANENEQFDMDGFMPAEDYGCSNNPQLYGPPQFEQLKFEVLDTDLNIEISFY